MHSSDYITGYESGLESKAGDESEVVFKARFESYVGSRNRFEVEVQKRDVKVHIVFKVSFQSGLS